MGSENRFTKLKDSFLDTFYDEDGFGGTEGLKKWVKDSTRNKALFIQMITKMLPANITLKGDEDNSIIKIEFIEVASKSSGGNSRKKKQSKAQPPSGEGAAE